MLRCHLIFRTSTGLLLRGAMNRAATIRQPIGGNLHHHAIRVQRLQRLKSIPIRLGITELGHQHATVRQVKPDVTGGKTFRIEQLGIPTVAFENTLFDLQRIRGHQWRDLEFLAVRIRGLTQDCLVLMRDRILAGLWIVVQAVHHPTLPDKPGVKVNVTIGDFLRFDPQATR